MIIPSLSVDFVIKSEPLSDVDRKAISAFIREDKSEEKEPYKKEKENKSPGAIAVAIAV